MGDTKWDRKGWRGCDNVDLREVKLHSKDGLWRAGACSQLLAICSVLLVVVVLGFLVVVCLGLLLLLFFRDALCAASLREPNLAISFQWFCRSWIVLGHLQTLLALLYTWCVTKVDVCIVGIKTELRNTQGCGERQTELDVFCYGLVWIFHSTSSVGWITSGNRRTNLLFCSNLHLQRWGSGSASVEQNL